MIFPAGALPERHFRRYPSRRGFFAGHRRRPAQHSYLLLGVPSCRSICQQPRRPSIQPVASAVGRRALCNEYLPNLSDWLLSGRPNSSRSTQL